MIEQTTSTIVGIHVGHDRCAALIKNGKLIASIAEERLDRVKYSPADKLPTLSINYVLGLANAVVDDVDIVAVSFSGVPHSEKVLRTWKLEIRRYFNIDESRILFVGHHLAHAYAVFYTSQFDDSAIMIADGAGDILNNGESEGESYYIAEEGKINLLYCRSQAMPTKYGSPLCEYRADYMCEDEMSLPISIGRKYEQVTKLIGFKFGQAGKTMGLAPYGNKTIDLELDSQGMEHSLNRGDFLLELDQLRIEQNETYDEFITKHKSDIAKSIQEITEQLLLKCIADLARATNRKNLCLSGGVFLNCVANKAILASKHFENVFITPTCGDDGQAIGAAYYAHSRLIGEPLEQSVFMPYLGKAYGEREYIEAIQKQRLPYLAFESEFELVDFLIEKLLSNAVIGIHRGRSESGPRALGNRSIIANPMSKTVKDHINHNIKFREDFRPFAAMVTQESAAKYFEIEGASPYMLLTGHVKSEFIHRLPATTHVDGSVRLQTVTKQSNPFIYALLSYFGDKTGFPILLNTSFNTANEPIIETPDDALNTLNKSNLDGVVLGDVYIAKASI